MTTDYQDLALDKTFTLGDEITDEQRAFLDQHGFLIFKGVASPDEVTTILEEADRIADQWLSARRKKVNGIPLFYGLGIDGQPYIQRLAFTSLFSSFIRDFVRDDRFAPIRGLIGNDTRVGDREKDGVVINRYFQASGSVYPKLGWHTDGLRDLFYLRMPKQMLNVGLHFDRIHMEDGGLRLIPGSHEQGFRDMCLRKLYFLDHRPDPYEFAIETDPGDLTIHDGRLWHRVEQSPHRGERSFRRSMYVPYLTDEYQPKYETSKTPFYHHLGSAMRKVQIASARLRS
jgi:ectoine hydroxylase-related dioxygenase (phytanoyl-CoA dioxygenase family)